MTTKIQGLIAAPFTPMKADTSLNLAAVGPYAEMLHSKGVAGGFVCGTTGESLLLTTEERCAITEEWVKVAPEGFKVIVHVGDSCLESCKTLSRHAQKSGAWAIGAMPPSFFRPQTLDDLVDFCAETAAAAPDLPYYYYHIPSMTNVCFRMADFLEVAKDRIPNLAGIKFTSEDLMDFQRCQMVDNGRFDMLFGRDEILICGLALGAQGAVGSTYSTAPRLYLRLIEAFQKGDLKTARALQRKSVEMIEVCIQASTPNNIASKAIVGMLGVDLGPVRAPLRNMTPDEIATLRTRLEEINFFEECV